MLNRFSIDTGLISGNRLAEKKKTTLKTISEALDISKTTVSLVLKGDGDRYRISKKTQNRILEYADQFGFEPDFLAKALATRKTSTIGLIFPDVHESFMSEMIRGIESVLYKAGYSIMLSTSGFNSDFELRNIRQLIRRKVDGIIIAPYIPISEPSFSHEYLAEIKKAACPSVFVDRIPPSHKDLNWIIQDDYAAAVSAVRLLHDKGCRRIGCLSFNLDISSINNRIRGYRDGLKSLGTKAKPEKLILLEEQNAGSDDLYRELKTIAESGNPVDGLIVTTGGIADKARHIIRSTDLGMPNLKIVKFGRDPQYFNSGMIQIIQPNVEMGKLAAKTILKCIDQPDTAAVQMEIKSIIKDGYNEAE